MHDGCVTKIRLLITKITKIRYVRNMRMYVIAHHWRPWRVLVIALKWTTLVAGRKQRDNKHDYR